MATSKKLKSDLWIEKLTPFSDKIGPESPKDGPIKNPLGNLYIYHLPSKVQKSDL